MADAAEDDDDFFVMQPKVVSRMTCELVDEQDGSTKSSRRIAMLEATLREIATTYDETEQTPAKLSAALYSVCRLATRALQ